MSQLLPGYLVPGNAIVNMASTTLTHVPDSTPTDGEVLQLSKSYSLQTLLTSGQILQDMKLGHYMKIPPRTTFVGM